MIKEAPSTPLNQVELTSPVKPVVPRRDVPTYAASWEEDYWEAARVTFGDEVVNRLLVQREKQP